LALGAALAVLALRQLGCARPPPLRPWPAPPQPPEVTLAAVGDVRLTDYRAASYSSVFGDCADLLAAADLSLVNLECALATGGEPEPKRYVFRAPPAAADALVRAGVDAVCVANNHALDYGRAAFRETLGACRSRGLLVVGGGEDSAAARQAVFLRAGRPDRQRPRVALLAYSNMQPTSFYVGPNWPGVNPADEKRLPEEVRAASRQADLTVVSFHWGDELSPAPNDRQRRLAHLAVDSGADLVIGHHPHVLQGLERYHRSIIAYSLGNFAFPSHSPRTRETAVLLCRWRPEELLVEIAPARIDGRTPHRLAGEEAAKLLRRLADLSAGLGTPLEVSGGSARLRTNPRTGVRGQRR
jgi:poly-gamma-glutamate synthesis protein (capsule biosynthesis protein)